MLPEQASTPRVDRTEFDAIEPPPVVTLYYCPACGQRVVGDYGLEPARKKCTKRWHLTTAKPVRYTRDGAAIRRAPENVIPLPAPDEL